MPRSRRPATVQRYPVGRHIVHKSHNGAANSLIEGMSRKKRRAQAAKYSYEFRCRSCGHQTDMPASPAVARQQLCGLCARDASFSETSDRSALTVCYQFTCILCGRRIDERKPFPLSYLDLTCVQQHVCPAHAPSPTNSSGSPRPAKRRVRKSRMPAPHYPRLFEETRLKLPHDYGE